MPNFVNPFRLPGQWYRGNTHTHSTASDGLLPIADRFAAYQAAGYDFLVLTDHRKVSDVSAYSADGFLAISGAEAHPANPYGGDTYHLVAIDIQEGIDCARLHPNEVIAEVNRQGGLVVICHPYWSGHTILDYLPLHGYFAVEVYNDTCMGIGKGFSEEMWDALIDKAGPVLGIAADDSHGTEHDCFHGWIMVKAPELTTAAIKHALRTGAFYSTMGPKIADLALHEEGGADSQGNPGVRRTLHVECSPARSIVFKCQRSSGRRFLAPPGGTLTSAEYAVPPGARYVRVEITDAEGRKAWSNPFFF